MSKRNNVIDNFEAVYLKANCAKKAFANTAALSKLTAEADFEKCVRYIANLTFNKNRSTLLRHGFDHDDMVNISRVFGMQFVNNTFEGETKKDTYYILMRFISQKMETFMVCMNRKFRISERHADISLEDVMSMDVYQSEQPMPDEVLEEEDESKAMKKLSTLQSDLEDLKSSVMRLRLQSNIGAYSERLSEIATSKLVEFSVRKKARSVCKKNGIDYIAWAKAQIRTKNLSEGDFIL
jgi:hypothetical protein